VGFIDWIAGAADTVGAAVAKNGVPPAVQEAMIAAGMSGDVQLGPGTPLEPAWGYNTRPRQYDYPTGTNINSRPRSTARVSFSTLRRLVETYDVAQLCITHRIDSIRALDWKIIPAKGWEAYDLDDAIAYAEAVLDKPDGELPFDAWLSKYLYDVFAFDAGTLYRQRNLAGQVTGLDVIDGTTIAPLLDEYGRRPAAPAPAYVQYIQGLGTTDLDETELIYSPFRPVSNSMYGRAPIESILLNANTDMRFQAFFMQRFTDGNIPAMFAVAPETWTPDQIRQFQETWDIWLAGNMAAKSQIKWIPGGTTLEDANAANAQFNKDMSDWLLRKTAAAYHVTPTDLGFTDQSNRSTGESQESVQERVADRPMCGHVGGILTRFMKDDLGLPLKFEFILDSDDEDGLAVAQADKVYVDMGAWSPSEVRERRLGLTDGPGERVPRFIATTKGPVPVSDLFASSTQIDPTSANPAPGTTIPATESQELDVAMTPQMVAATAPAGQQPAIAAAKAELAKFARYRSDRIRKGRAWRDFNFTALPARFARELNRAARIATRKGEISVAGLLVQAQDTGRVLMIQRALDPADPAQGKWEFPGGHLEDSEAPWQAAVREWQEEVGCRLPDGATFTEGTWTNGHYQGFIMTVTSEADVPCRIGSAEVLNPDDPDGDMIETVAWWDPNDLLGNPAVRAELQASLDAVLAALDTEADAAPLAKGWRDGQPKTPMHKYDLRIVDYYQPRIQDVITAWVKALPIRSVAAQFAGADATAYAYALHGGDPLPLGTLLRQLATDGYLTGQHGADIQLGRVEKAATLEATNTLNWDTWAPGNPAAADTAAAGGLAQLLAEQDVTIKSVEDNLYGELGDRIASGLADGLSPDEIASSIADLVNPASRAEMIAATETARAQTAGSLFSYQANGVAAYDLILADGACLRCEDAAAANPHPLSDGSAQPPLHPYCRCSTSPVVQTISPDSMPVSDLGME
jgi:8-oxo-dGTP pyrophosphatase MutT (NUDIX family)